MRVKTGSKRVVVNVWSDEARRAAAEARKAHAQGGGEDSHIHATVAHIVQHYHQTNESARINGEKERPVPEKLHEAVTYAHGQKAFGNKYLDTMESEFGIREGTAMRIADHVREHRSKMAGGTRSAAEARADRVLHIRDSSGGTRGRRMS